MVRANSAYSLVSCCQKSRGNPTAGNASCLELNEGEATARADATVVLDSGAADNGSQQVDGTRSDLSNLGLTRIPAARLLSRLYIDSSELRRHILKVRRELPGRSGSGHSVANPIHTLAGCLYSIRSGYSPCGNLHVVSSW
jgi:hypothetical protein